jgi:hypothetical protein
LTSSRSSPRLGALAQLLALDHFALDEDGDKEGWHSPWTVAMQTVVSGSVRRIFG